MPYDKTTVKDAPRISDSDGHLSEDEEATLYRYYGTEGAEHDTSYAGSNDTHGTVGHDTSGPETDSSMTRSEEQVRVGTETREAGRVRLRKYVVTENVTQTVPVERVRVGKDTVTEQHEVDETVRKEEIELDESDASSRTASDRTRH